jgi:A/G-specific adenine glycosylase
MNFAEILKQWYKKNKRELPMRQTFDPYRIWVGEVILQQTRMDQGLPYYRAFLESFPDVRALASAHEDEVLRLWQGLGYYSRARNMHASARYIVEELGGAMPNDYQGLLKLKGVGKYTAAAIASWCYKEPCAAVDGNVSRLISRLFGIEDAINSPGGERRVQALATELLDPVEPGIHNQAMIEFGALQCVPVSPGCLDCPLAELCEANQRSIVDRIPLKIKNKKPINRWFYYYILRSGDECILIRRGKTDIWAGLYEFPMIETGGPQTDEEIVKLLATRLLLKHETGTLLEDPGAESYTDLPLGIGALSEPVRHQLSHQTIHARFLQVEAELLPDPLPENWQRVSMDQLDRYAMPRLIHRYLESFKI